jgi:hypothetical protein
MRQSRRISSPISVEAGTKPRRRGFVIKSGRPALVGRAPVAPWPRTTHNACWLASGATHSKLAPAALILRTRFLQNFHAETRQDLVTHLPALAAWSPIAENRQAESGTPAIARKPKLASAAAGDPMPRATPSSSPWRSSSSANCRGHRCETYRRAIREGLCNASRQALFGERRAFHARLDPRAYASFQRLNHRTRDRVGDAKPAAKVFKGVAE